MRITSTTTIKKAIACTVVGIGLAAGLVACSGGSGLSGEYYDDEGQLVIQGDSVAFYPFGCSDAVEGEAVLESEPSAEGGLSEDGAQVVWASDDEHLGSDRIGGSSALVAPGTGDAVELDGRRFFAMDKGEAVSGYDGMC
ncbi:hypothetical protein [Zhihengliuella sp.]|uniref:hypothetical protein n=1 Tax=Zhihengliuella sp. TaxID=1954483 RepID=UPI00281136B6|nr:hypothetical protein [Zhihengliuella sp.]